MRNKLAHYAIGDVQGCCGALQQLLRRLHFHPARDRVWFTGDLVNRGPRSADTARLVMDLGDAADSVLGNHDLHLLAVAAGAISMQKSDTFADLVDAPDADAITTWLRHRPLALTTADTLLVHAGVHPHWTPAATLRHAAEVEHALRTDPTATLHNLYGNEPARWSDTLTGHPRRRLIINILTRIRWCDAGDGALDFTRKGAPGGGDGGGGDGGDGAAGDGRGDGDGDGDVGGDVGDGGGGGSSDGDGADGGDGGTGAGGLVPWFQAPNRRTRDRRIVFGHWAALGLYRGDGVLGIDTGYCWGGALTAVRLDAPGEVVQVEAGAAPVILPLSPSP